MSLKRDVPGNAVQPACDGCFFADGCGLAHQHQEGGLKGVLNILFVFQNTPANGPNHAAVPLYQFFKRGFIALEGEPLQQVIVGRRPSRGPAKVGFQEVQNRSKRCTTHDFGSWDKVLIPL
jgi:hypothetical protein